NETYIVGSIYKDFDVHLLEQTGLGKNQDAFDDYDWLGLNRSSVGQPRMGAKIVDGKFDRFTSVQLLKMIDQQLLVDRIRMIEVRRIPIVQRHVLEIAIVKILLDENHFVRADRLQDAIRDR